MKWKNARQEILYNALERKLPEGWVINSVDFGDGLFIHTPNIKDSTLRIDIVHKGVGIQARIRFQPPHRTRQFNRKNAEHFATVVADEARRVEDVERVENAERYERYRVSMSNFEYIRR